jgi:hypothetical protein
MWLIEEPDTQVRVDSRLGLIARHLAANQPLIRHLRASGRSEIEVLALILTETFFRDKLHRILEYSAWMILAFVWPARVCRLSVGISQMQLRHWVRLGYLQNVRPRFAALRTTMCAEANYDVCRSFLVSTGVELSNPRRLGTVYCGEARAYHHRILCAFIAAIGGDNFQERPR